MAKKYDIVIYGASGFTGERIVYEALRIASVETPLRIAIGGRSEAKLRTVLISAAARVPAASSLLADVGIIIADVTDAAALERMARSTRLLLNAVGPYRYHGFPVVKAAIAGGCDYLDVSGEPDFIERVEFELAAAAAKAGVLVVSACGFDSIPCDLGVLDCQRRFAPPSVPSAVECFLTCTTKGNTKMVGHFATYECIVLGIATVAELRALRKAAARPPPPPPPGPKIKVRTSPYWEPRVGAWALPFPGADASVVRRTQAALASDPSHAPVSFAAYFTLPSRWHLLRFTVYGAVFMFLAGRSWGRKLLLEYPALFSGGLFTKKGPTEKQMADTSFSMTFFGKGYTNAKNVSGAPDRIISTTLTGPEPGYVATPIVLLQAALTVLEERGNCGLSGGAGVFTACAAFANTTLLARLKGHGIGLEKQSDQSIVS